MTPDRLARAAAAFMLAVALVFPVGAQITDFAQAEQFYRQGQLENALMRVDAHLSTRPRDARGLFLKAMILAAQNRTAEAIALYTALTQDYPELAEPYNNLAVLHAAQGDYDKARAALEMAVRADPSFAAAHENLGDIYARMALRSYQRAAGLEKGGGSIPRKLKVATELVAIPPGR